MSATDTPKRSLVKTLIFKIITTSITALFVGLSGAITIHLILTAVYLIYERIWNRIDWGRKPLNHSYEMLRNEKERPIPSVQNDGQPV